jgi:hypothetical protein
MLWEPFQTSCKTSTDTFARLSPSFDEQPMKCAPVTTRLRSLLIFFTAGLYER